MKSMDQVLTAQSHLEGDRRISSVVLMGMGEPLANLWSLWLRLLYG